MKRPVLPSPALRHVALALLLSPAFGACVKDAPSGSSDPGLQAMLDDDELVGVHRQAQVLEPPDARAATGSGGSMASMGPKDRDAGVASDASFSPDTGDFIDESPVGFWPFDDCNPDRTELFDNAFRNNTAFRSVRASCALGVQGQGVSLPNPRDIVYVPDQPSFAFNDGLTVAAWVKPTAITGSRTIARKREAGTSSFALMLNDRRFQVIIARKGAAPVQVSSAVIRKDVWTHVAATYDGTFLRLYVDGTEAARTRAPGVIDTGEGPLLFGNDGSQRRIEGTLDNAWFSTRAVSAATILGLTCIRHKPDLAFTPTAGPAVGPGTPVTFTARIANRNAASCPAENFSLQTVDFVPDFQIDPQFSFTDPVASGTYTDVPVTITAGSDAEPGTQGVRFQASGSIVFDPTVASVQFTVTATGCRVLSRRELMIRDVGVVDDPIRTTFSAPTTDARRGAWTFARLARELGASAADAPDMVESMFSTFLSPQTVNGFVIPPRPAMKTMVLDPWARTANGKLDLEKAPLRLLTIVNRLDLRDTAKGQAGEGRFVFGVLDPGGNPLEFTVIFEFALPGKTPADVTVWARDWHALGALPFPSEEYNTALAALTTRFVKRGAFPGRPGSSALNALRTNEIALGNVWQLREFTLDPTTARPRPDTTKLTPDPSLDQTPALAAFINANEPAILSETHDVPQIVAGAPFLGGGVFNQLNGWDAPGINNPEARHKFSLNTCNGCHSLQETNTFFLQVSNRFPGQQAGLSGFLTGTTVFDSQTGQARTFNDLDRRNRDMHPIVCPNDPLPPVSMPDAGPVFTPDGGMPRPKGTDAGVAVSPAPITLTKGISRTH